MTMLRRERSRESDFSIGGFFRESYLPEKQEGMGCM